MITDKYDQKAITLGLVKYSGVNPRIFDLLLQVFGSLDEILMAEESELAALEGISANAANRISRVVEHLEKAAREIENLTQKNIKVTTRFDSDYPVSLLEINDPPPIFYSRGQIPQVNQKTVALIGTVEATQEGIALTAKVAKDFISKNVQVLSALDTGISTAVHLGAKAGGGHSFAVIDRGLDKIEGEGAIPLAIDIILGGGIISEYEPDKGFSEKNFGESNRLLAGMAQAVVVTEFDENSKRVLDILEYCNQIGKLSFFLADPEYGVLSDEKSLGQAVKNGAILMKERNSINDIVKALV